MVLSMLSPVPSVKLQTSTDPSTSTASNNSRAPSGDSLGTNNRSSDMSRRKQKNPKPFFTSNDDQEESMDDKSTDGKNNNLDSSFNSNQSDEEEMTPPEDLSSLVKVEMEEGFGPVIDTQGPRGSISPRGSYTPSPPPSTSRLPLPPGIFHHLPHLPPPPPLSRLPDPFQQAHHPKDIPNMFHFGDVVVNHHPDTPPVPMVIPMVYLYPFPGQEQNVPEVRYRMFVPLGAPVEAIPGFHPGASHLLSEMGIHRPEAPNAIKTPRKSSDIQTSSANSTTPLDLRKSPGSRSEESPSTNPDDECILPDRALSSPGGSGRTPSESGRIADPNTSLKQKEIEAQLQFLKAKQFEFFQSHQKQAAAAIAVAKMSRCEECNINFSKYQNYVAHKKYYCSASAKSNPPPAPVQVASDNEEDEPIPGPAPKAVKHENGSQARGSTPTPPLSSTPSLTKSHTPSLTSPNPEGNVKELKLVKPQDLLQESAPSLILPGGNVLNHFVCEGCGIKFKSVSNLQAHQARYCAGLRKSEEMASLEVALKRSQKPHRVSPPQLPLPLTAADMMTFLNAKSLEHQLVAAATQAQLAAAITKEKQPPSISSVMAAAMAGSSGTVLNGAGVSADDYCCILCGYKEQSVERLKDHINLHFIGQIKRRQMAPSPSAKSPRTVSNGSASTNGSGADDGAPEPKRIKTESSTSAGPSPRHESEDVEDKNGESSSSPRSSPRPPIVIVPHPSPPGALVTPKIEPGLRCQACDIGFSHLSNLMAHKKFYCRGLQAVGAERHSP